MFPARTSPSGTGSWTNYLSPAPQAEPQAEGFSSGLSEEPQAAGASAGLSEAPQALPQAGDAKRFQEARFASAMYFSSLLDSTVRLWLYYNNGKLA